MLDILIIILISIVLGVLVVFFSVPSLSIAFIKSRRTEYPISFKTLFWMYLKRQNLNKMVEANNIIHLNDLQISLKEVERFSLLGGSVDYLLDEALKYKQNNKEFIFEDFLKSNS
jgi:uncharacterized protein YqfA (UPF0365 family)